MKQISSVYIPTVIPALCRDPPCHQRGTRSSGRSVYRTVDAGTSSAWRVELAQPRQLARI